MLRDWHEYLSTGWNPIDEEHAEVARHLHAVLSAVNAGDTAALRRILRDLLDAVARHFAHEERLMLEHAYPAYARHKDAHDLYLADIAEFSRRADAEGITVPLRRWATGRVLSWFSFHVAANDMGLVTFLRDPPRRSSVAGVPAGMMTRGV